MQEIAVLKRVLYEGRFKGHFPLKKEGS